MCWNAGRPPAALFQRPRAFVAGVLLERGDVASRLQVVIAAERGGRQVIYRCGDSELPCSRRRVGRRSVLAICVLLIELLLARNAQSLHDVDREHGVGDLNVAHVAVVMDHLVCRGCGSCPA